jgi:hypothetical protein
MVGPCLRIRPIFSPTDLRGMVFGLVGYESVSKKNPLVRAGSQLAYQAFLPVLRLPINREADV